MDFYNKQNLTYILKQYKFNFKKKLGQNFLINKDIVNQIVDLYDNSSHIIEIGPGIGHLTNLLAQKVKSILAIEIDNDLIKIFNILNKCNNINIIQGDILKIDLFEIHKEYFKDQKKISICANIPYYITSDLIFKLVNVTFLYDITLMLQNEVVDRMTANVGDKLYGSFSIYLNYFFELKKIAIVLAKDFIPTPKIDSAIINMKHKKRFFPNNEELFLKIVFASFLHRRKKLINSIVYSKKIDISKKELEEIFNIINLSENTRAEELNIDDFVKLSNLIYRYISKKGNDFHDKL